MTLQQQTIARAIRLVIELSAFIGLEDSHDWITEIALAASRNSDAEMKNLTFALAAQVKAAREAENAKA